MQIVAVAARNQAKRHIKKFRATHLVSTVDPLEYTFRHPKMPPENHLELHYYDTDVQTDAGAPTKNHVERIIHWVRALPKDARIVVNCSAGISRSSAIALIVTAMETGNIDMAAGHLLLLNSEAEPNLLVLAHADEILGLDGKLVAAGQAVTTATFRKVKPDEIF